ncbi:MAG: dATP/dGTP pyrophosphohydrolase domain-containing protein [Pseudomonadota bacterium]
MNFDDTQAPGVPTSPAVMMTVRDRFNTWMAQRRTVGSFDLFDIWQGATDSRTAQMEDEQRKAMLDAVAHGTGIVRMSADGGAEHVPYVEFVAPLPPTIQDDDVWEIDAAKAGLIVNGNAVHGARLHAFYNGHRAGYERAITGKANQSAPGAEPNGFPTILTTPGVDIDTEENDGILRIAFKCGFSYDGKGSFDADAQEIIAFAQAMRAPMATQEPAALSDDDIIELHDSAFPRVEFDRERVMAGVVKFARALIGTARQAPQAVAALDRAGFDFRAHLARQAAWSELTFGPGMRTAGVCDHIRKELTEVEADPSDLEEWVDVVILALDGAWRCGGTPDQIIGGIVAKQAKNEGRVWPDWRTADPSKAIEHDRTGEAIAQPSAVPFTKPILMAYVATDLDGHADVGMTIEIAKERAGEYCNTIIALHDISTEFVEFEGKPCAAPAGEKGGAA